MSMAAQTVLMCRQSGRGSGFSHWVTLQCKGSTQTNVPSASCFYGQHAHVYMTLKFKACCKG